MHRKRMSPVRLKFSYDDMRVIASWHLGYDLGNAALVEHECRRLEKKRWKFERIMKAFQAGKIESLELRKILQAFSAHSQKSLKLRNRLWADFEKYQPKRRKKKKS